MTIRHVTVHVEFTTIEFTVDTDDWGSNHASAEIGAAYLESWLNKLSPDRALAVWAASRAPLNEYPFDPRAFPAGRALEKAEAEAMRRATKGWASAPSGLGRLATGHNMSVLGIKGA